MEEKTNWFKNLKTKLAKALPDWADDQIDHFQIMHFLGTVATVFSVTSDRSDIGLACIIGLLVGAVLWEVQSLIENKFSMKSIKESLKDLGMAVLALFGYGVVLLYLYTA